MSDAINDTLDALSKRIPDPVTRRQLAGILDMAMQSFANWDCQGRGIGGSVKIAGRVFYRRSDVLEWLRSKACEVSRTPKKPTLLRGGDSCEDSSQ